MGRKKHRVGYPIALLIHFTDRSALFLLIFSASVRILKSIPLKKKRSNSDEKELYAFHESLINEIRPFVKQGVTGIMLGYPPKTNFGEEFIDHVKKHHQWLTNEDSQNAIHFASYEIDRSTQEEILYYTKSEAFQAAVQNLLDKAVNTIGFSLEKRINMVNLEKHILYTLEDIEARFRDKISIQKKPPEAIILTTTYFEAHKQISLLQWLIQTAKNRKIKVQIINAETPVGQRVEQFGGIICFL